MDPADTNWQDCQFAWRSHPKGEAPGMAQVNPRGVGGSVVASLLAMTLLISTNIYAFSWDDLWFRQDQQAEKAMNAGKLKEAAKLFQNQNWQGVANYRSGDYKAALNNFQQNTTATGYYNQGNALAQMGNYQQAIAAYDKALAQNPDMTDAKFNKELLEKLQKQQPKNDQKSNPQNDKPTDNNKKNNNQSAQSSNNQNQSKQDNQSQSSQSQSNQNQSQQNQQNQSAQSQDQNNQSQTQQNQQQASQKQSQQNAKGGQQQTEKQSAKNQQQQGQKTQPLNEQKQATEQWLRGIPDDPGGLLKQKFLRDHQSYQAQQQQGKSSW